MATLLRLSELRCPYCHEAAWVMDNEYRGMDGIMIPYSERDYPCKACGHRGSGWALLQQGPAEVLLQPHPFYPMTQADFDHWISVLKTNFPDHPPPDKPCLPEDAVRELEKTARFDSRHAATFRKHIDDLKARFGLDRD